MAVIEASGHLHGEAGAEARAGLCVSVAAKCEGRASGGLGPQPPMDEEDERTEPQSPQGK